MAINMVFDLLNNEVIGFNSLFGVLRGSIAGDEN
jgi:hypothetical protein